MAEKLSAEEYEKMAKKLIKFHEETREAIERNIAKETAKTEILKIMREEWAEQKRNGIYPANPMSAEDRQLV